MKKTDDKTGSTTRINESVVSTHNHSLRLDSYLAGRFTYLTRTEWQKKIKQKRITVNGVVIATTHKKVKEGDVICYEHQQQEEPEVDTNYQVLYEDKYLVAVNKPGQLPVHPAGKFFNNTLVMLLQDDLNETLYPVHRLDRETSGVVLFARNKEIVSFFHKEQPGGAVEKMYTAIVHGTIQQQSFTVDMPIGPDHNSPVRKKRAAYADASEHAVTHFEKTASFVKPAGKHFSIVNARLETGRQHQIRVHLLYAGYPILGDKLYGLDDSFYLEFIEKGYSEDLLQKIGFPRSALHAALLSFMHPQKNELITIEAPLPKDMREFISP